MTRAVFLDRDGVINKAVVMDGVPHPPRDVSEVVIDEGVPEALEMLKSAGFRLVVVTNQPDVARGTQTKEAVVAINDYLKSGLDIDEIRVCYHDDRDNCDCRKPRPGLLVGYADEEGVELAKSYMIGDRWRDMDAGQNAGCTTVFIDRGYAEPLVSKPDLVVGSLLEAARWIVDNCKEGEL